MAAKKELVKVEEESEEVNEEVVVIKGEVICLRGWEIEEGIVEAWEKAVGVE